MNEIYILFLSFFLSLPGQNSQPQKIEKGSSILLVGDSLAFGLAPQFVKLSRENKYASHTHCIGGTNTMQWSQKIQEDLTSFKPKLVLVSLGTNESGFWGQFIIDHPEIYLKFVSKIRKSGARLVWIGPPALPMDKLPQQNKVRELIKMAADTYYDSESLSIQRASDQIHSTSDGYKDWMNHIWSWMAEQNIIEND